MLGSTLLVNFTKDRPQWVAMKADKTHLLVHSTNRSGELVSTLIHNIGAISTIQVAVFRNLVISPSQLSTLLHYWEHLHTLVLVHCKMDQTDTDQLVKIFRDRKNIEQLVLNDTPIPSEISSKLKTSSLPLRSFSLSKLQLNPTQVEDLSDLLKNLPCLQKLTLAYITCEGNDFQKIIITINQLSTVRTLLLSHCNLGTEEVKALQFTHLKPETLDLSFNWIGDDATCTLAFRLSQIPLLKSLNLSMNQIGSSGVVALAANFKHWPHLERLDLNRNPIPREGNLAIDLRVHQLTSLKTLKLMKKTVG